MEVTEVKKIQVIGEKKTQSKRRIAAVALSQVLKGL
jgi:hypothetical protein